MTPTYPSLAELSAKNSHGCGKALDTGCGPGLASIYLLEKSWKVVAIDKDPEMVMRLQRKVARLNHQQNIVVQCADFILAELPEVHLMHAGYAMQYVPPYLFDATWRKLTACIAYDGIFAGQFFGTHDLFGHSKDYSVFDEASCRSLFSQWELLMFDTYLGPGHRNPERIWHFFTVVAPKKFFDFRA